MPKLDYRFFYTPYTIKDLTVRVMFENFPKIGRRVRIQKDCITLFTLLMKRR